MPMLIGDISIDPPITMAPIAGMTDLPFRSIVLRFGAGMATTELLSAKALTLGSEKTFGMLPRPGEPGIIAVQLFGGEPEVMRDAAVIASEGRADIIDLNFGCPVKKVTKTGGGAAVLRDLKLASKITRAVVDAVKKPVTAKIRIGWDKNGINAPEAAKALQDSGVLAIAIHGRTASQGYSGLADWEVISKTAAAVSIPVIGNGDIASPEGCASRLENSGCAGVMIGRAALGWPWIFRQSVEFLNSGEYGKISMDTRKDTAVAHLDAMAEHYGQRAAVGKMRGWLGYYTKGLVNGASFRREVNHAGEMEGIRELINIFFGQLAGENRGKV